jgi:hypothetical protein
MAEETPAELRPERMFTALSTPFAAVALASAAAVAVVVPATRASRVDPAVALKRE